MPPRPPSNQHESQTRIHSPMPTQGLLLFKNRLLYKKNLMSLRSMTALPLLEGWGRRGGVGEGKLKLIAKKFVPVLALFFPQILHKNYSWKQSLLSIPETIGDAIGELTWDAYSV